MESPRDLEADGAPHRFGFELCGLGTRLGRAAPGADLATGVERGRDHPAHVQVVGRWDAVEIQGRTERSLVENGAEGQHWIVRPGVARLELQLGPERRVRLRQAGLGGSDSLLGDPGIRAVGHREGDGLFESPGLCGAGPSEHQRREREDQRRPKWAGPSATPRAGLARRRIRRAWRLRDHGLWKVSMAKGLSRVATMNRPAGWKPAPHGSWGVVRSSAMSIAHFEITLHETATAERLRRPGHRCASFFSPSGGGAPESHRRRSRVQTILKDHEPHPSS